MTIPSAPNSSAPNYQKAREQFGEYGIIEALRYPLAYVRGLPNVSHDEAVIFETGTAGQVLGFDEELVEVLLLDNTRLTPGVKVARTGQPIAISISDKLRGHAINPLAQSLTGATRPSGYPEQRRGARQHPIDHEPPHISARASITQQFLTGTTTVDLLLPLARGQREAVVGDPTTGKSSFLLTTVRAHAETGIVIYAAIGKPWNDIKKAHTFITEQTKQQNVIMIAASADDPISLIYLAPFTAMTIAEAWRDAGHDVLLILDDLSTHAKAYREISLLARRFPTRESYPGDIFHLHARLLERAGNFKHPKKQEVSITCLPVAETVEGDLTGYIVSNLISITDGHLLFDETIFSSGRRPAINIPLSVTRIGSHTQTKLIRELNRQLIALLNKYDEARRYSHFGAELPQNLKQTIDAGDALLNFLSQPLYRNIPYPVQVIMSAMILRGWLNEHKRTTATWRDCLVSSYTSSRSAKSLIDRLLKAADLATFNQQLAAQQPKLTTLCQVPAKSNKQ